MKCAVCGAESGKYPLCRECNKKRQTGEIIKCKKCNKWHYAVFLCEGERDLRERDLRERNLREKDVQEKDGTFLYELKPSLVTNSEMSYLKCIKDMLPEGYLIQPQANLASFIVRTDGAKFQNELYRNVDFVITDLAYKPLILIEINDQTHRAPDRMERDKKVTKICEEAGIPIITLWTSYGVNPEYIKKRIDETIAQLPVKRIHHFIKEKEAVAIDTIEYKYTIDNLKPVMEQKNKKAGCYIATCIYGSYDCPQVWTLRRFRDDMLAGTWYGRCFIKCYYAISPALVRWFGSRKWFRKFWKLPLDKMVDFLNKKGIANTLYNDKTDLSDTQK